jgi:hypothetical protein
MGDVFGTASIDSYTTKPLKSKAKGLSGLNS